MNRLTAILLVVVLLLSAACGSAEPETGANLAAARTTDGPTPPAVEPIDTPTEAAAEEAVAEEAVAEEAVAEEAAVEPAAVEAVEDLDAATATVDWLSTASIEGDYYVLGNPNAPVRLIDYSDFL